MARLIMQLFGMAAARRAHSADLSTRATLKPLLGYLTMEPVTSFHHARTLLDVVSSLADPAREAPERID